MGGGGPSSLESDGEKGEGEDQIFFPLEGEKGKDSPFLRRREVGQKRGDLLLRKGKGSAKSRKGVFSSPQEKEKETPAIWVRGLGGGGGGILSSLSRGASQHISENGGEWGGEGVWKRFISS